MQQLMALALTMCVLGMAPSSASATLESVVSTQPQLHTLTALISACPAVASAANQSSTAVTLFAPTDQAFQAALAQLNVDPTSLIGNTQLLCSILELHITATIIHSNQATSTPISVPSLLPGANLTIVLTNGAVYVNNAKVLVPDIIASASIIHIIDHVLLPPTLASVAASVPELSTLLAAVQASPPVLAVATNPLAQVTLFAPTNEAFAALLAALNTTAAALLANTALLTTVLKYHVVAQVIPSSAATAQGVSVATLEGANVLIKRVNGSVFVNNAQVVIADVPAGLSIVHVINQVLLPPTSPTPSPSPSPSSAPVTIASVAASVPTLSTLLAAVKASPTVLQAATDPNTTVTVFAPTNAAFAKLLKALHITADQLLSNEKLLTIILEYHIVPQVIPSSAIKGPAYKTTLLAGADLKVNRVKGKVKVNSATVIQADVPAGKSVVHVIDEVLLPSFWVLLYYGFIVFFG